MYSDSGSFCGDIAPPAWMATWGSMPYSLAALVVRRLWPKYQAGLGRSDAPVVVSQCLFRLSPAVCTVIVLSTRRSITGCLRAPPAPESANVCSWVFQLDICTPNCDAVCS